MKLRNLFTVAAAALMLTACNNSNQGSSVSSSSSVKGDSLVYLFGQLRGTEYVREAMKDTALNTPENKKEYLSGVKAGLVAVKHDKEVYNKGFYLGLQMAMNISQFEKDYGVRLPNREFVKGISSVIDSDSTLNTSEVQASFYRIMNEFQKEKEERDKAAAVEALTKAGEAANLQKISDDLWGKKPSDDQACIKDGDKVKVDVKVTDLSGKPIQAPFPKELKVGQRMQNNPITTAIKSLVSGQTGNFLSTAQAVFGNRCSQLGIEPDDVVKIEVTPTIVEENSKPE